MSFKPLGTTVIGYVYNIVMCSVRVGFTFGEFLCVILGNS